MKLRLPYQSDIVRVTSPYGMRTLIGETAMHKGVDLVGTDKTIVAPCDGKIGWAGEHNDKATGGRTWEWGKYVRLETSDGYAVYMCHMSSICVKAGQSVKAGDKIGIEGSTGYSTGSHLHFEVRKGGKATDPALLLGIANRVSSYMVEAELVGMKAGLESKTRKYLGDYKWGKDLCRKLLNAMK